MCIYDPICSLFTAHSEDVLLVIQRAEKDVAVEELLKNLEEVWLSMQFQLKPHIRLQTSDQVHVHTSNVHCR